MVKALNNAPDDYRYERKFYVDDLTRQEIELIVKLHPARFSEIYQPRYVNNLYLDSVGMENFFENVNGLNKRLKVRIRWYGHLFGPVEKPVLELKIKNGLVGRKESFSLVPFSMDNSFQRATLVDLFRRSEIPETLRLELISLQVALLNRYRRKYFLAADRKVRLTIDSEMQFYQVGPSHNTFLNKFVDSTGTVVELKYHRKQDQSIEQISNHFPVRMTRSSKYVNGIAQLYF